LEKMTVESVRTTATSVASMSKDWNCAVADARRWDSERFKPAILPQTLQVR
jgi:hypothetical protein